jgi:hypothetical protein
MKKTLFIIACLIASCNLSEPSVEEADVVQLKEYQLLDTAWIDKNGNSLLILEKDDGAFGSHIEGYAYKNNSSGKIFFIHPPSSIFKDWSYNWFGDSLVYFYDSKLNQPVGEYWMVVKDSLTSFYYHHTGDTLHHNSIIYAQGKIIKLGDKFINVDSTYVKSLRNRVFKLTDVNKLKEIGSYDEIELRTLKNGIYYCSFPGIKIEHIVKLKELH